MRTGTSGRGLCPSTKDGTIGHVPDRDDSVDIANSFSCQSSVTFSNSGTHEPPLFLESVPWEQPDFPLIDWDTLDIQESRDEEGRIETIGQDETYVILGLRDEDERAKEAAAKEAAAKDVETQGGTIPVDIDCAAIPVDDSIPEERYISYDKDNPPMKLGVCYPDMNEFRLAVRQYAINGEFELGTECSDRKRFRGYCTGEGCPWTIVGNRQSDKRTIMITLLVDKHDCISTSRIKTTIASKSWVAAKAVPILIKDDKMGATKLQKKFWKAEIKKVSPGSVVEIDIEVVDGRVYFHRFFCALASCIEGFKAGCRPYLSIDGTSLNGRWNGHLASATGVYGNNWMYPVAFGFIGSETEPNWIWFMSQLNKAIGNLCPLAICTDACKGLENAVKKVFPQAEQGECFRHLMQNFIKRYSGDTFGRMYLAARAYRIDLFDHHMKKILKASEEVGKYLAERHSLKWMRCAFNPVIKCDYITNNLAEVFNNWVKDYKDLLVTELADKIREMIMVLWERRRRMRERFNGWLLPTIRLQLKARTRGLGHLRVIRSATYFAEVWDNSRDNHAPRINKTKKARTDSTPVKQSNTRGPLLEDSAGMLTRRRIAMLREEGSNNQSITTAGAGANPTTPTGSTLVKTVANTATKKITPKKRKRNLQDCY